MILPRHVNPYDTRTITTCHSEMSAYRSRWCSDVKKFASDDVMYVIMLLFIGSGIPFPILPVGNTTVAHGSAATSHSDVHAHTERESYMYD